VTGIDNIPKALRAARERARQAGVDVQFLQGDVTALRAAGVGSGFRFFLDLGCFHGLDDAQRDAMGREVSAVAAPDATLLILVWAPGSRGPLPRGANHDDIERAFPSWKIIDMDSANVSALPKPLKNVDPRCYRLGRAQNSRTCCW
jgi:SAM-dependent methyltransferase